MSKSLFIACFLNIFFWLGEVSVCLWAARRSVCKCLQVEIVVCAFCFSFPSPVCLYGYILWIVIRKQVNIFLLLFFCLTLHCCCIGIFSFIIIDQPRQLGIHIFILTLTLLLLILILLLFFIISSCCCCCFIR